MSSRQLVIREASLEDAPAIVELIHAAFGEYRGVLVPPSSALDESVHSIRSKLSTGGGLIADVAGKSVGSVLLARNPDSLYLGRLAVLPAFRGRGIASRLVVEVERRAIEQGLPRVTLGARLALPGNLALFQRLGYRVYERARHPESSEDTYARFEKRVASLTRSGS